VIVSHSKRFVFFKPIKTAGTSIECSLWDICNKNIDIYTGSALKSEISSKDFNFLPANNWHQEKILNREEGLDYFKKHKKYNLINSLLDNSDIKNIRIVEPIFFEHTSPVMASKNRDIYRDYLKISIIRNPFDMLVSYYWWSFNVEDTINESFNQKYEKNKKLTSSICPNENDSIDVLKEKMSKFYSLPAKFNHSYRNGNDNITLLQWLSEWQNEFFLSKVDFWIRFEQIEKSLESLSSKIECEIKKPPMFKTRQRKSKILFKNYFNDSLKKETIDCFKDTFERFNYSKSL
jgi:hypothetical protein